MKSTISPKVGDKPKVCVVVLTWNDIEMTRNCLLSVYDSGYDNLDLILVDNGSVEPCGTHLKQEFPDLNLITLKENRGFTGGCNAGITKALEMSADYVYLLNNDTVVHHGTIDKLVRYSEDHRDCGIVSSILLFPNEKKVQFYRATIDRDCVFHYHHNVNDPLGEAEWPSIESEFVPACAILFRSSALNGVGLFDESFGTCWEDYDLCLRYLNAGWKIVTVGDAFVDHRSHSTTGAISPYITYYTTRNRLICLFRYANKAKMLKRSPFLIRTFYWQIKEYGLLNWKCHASFAHALWDFLTGIRGEAGTMKSRANS